MLTKMFSIKFIKTQNLLELTKLFLKIKILKRQRHLVQVQTKNYLKNTKEF